MVRKFLSCLMLLGIGAGWTQAQTFQSRVLPEVYTEVVLKKTGEKSYTFSKKATTANKNLQAQSINLTQTPLVDNMLRFDPKKSVWFIPFNPDFPAMRVSGAGVEDAGCWAYQCEGAKVLNVGNNQVCASKEPCTGFLVKINCDSKKQEAPIYFTGGGIFVEAEEVSEE